MAKIILNDVTNINSLSVINDNFDKIEAELQNKILYRDNPVGETNSISQDIDFNGKLLLNIGGVIPGTDSFPAKYLGAFTSNPSSGLNGADLVDGNLYFRTGSPAKALMVFNGSTWIEASPTTITNTNSIDPSLHASSAEVNSGVNTNKVITPYSLSNSKYGAISSNLAITSDPTKGAGLVGFGADVAYPEGTTGDHLHQRIMPTDAPFLADNTGVTNATAALLAFFNQVIFTGKAGHIPAGTYLVDEGALVLDNGFSDKPFPDITTDGYQSVVFQASGASNAPLLSITNGVATGAGEYWRGGHLGGITFRGAGTSSGKHGLLLRGIWGAKFGYMRGENLGGDVINIPLNLYGGSNPDPYAVALCDFFAVDGLNCKGKVFNNQNFLGWTGCTIHHLTGVGMEGGGLHGLGSGNEVEFMSYGGSLGWAIDDGTNAGAAGGPPSRFDLGVAELDDVENGIRINRLSQFDFERVRFVHRFAGTTLNTSGKYWPLKAIDLSGGTSPNVSNGSMHVAHRIDSGGVKADVGIFLTGNSNANIANIKITIQVSDNAGFGFVDSDFYAGITSSTTVALYMDSRRIFDTLFKVAVFATSSSTETVAASAAWGTSGAKIAFPTERYDRGAYYDTTNSWFVVPFSGLYRVHAGIHLNVAAGTQVRLGIAFDRGGSIGLAATRERRQPSANVEAYEVGGLCDFSAGDKVFVMGSQSTGAPVNLSNPVAPASDLQFSIEAVL